MKRVNRRSSPDAAFVAPISLNMFGRKPLFHLFAFLTWSARAAVWLLALASILAPAARAQNTVPAGVQTNGKSTLPYWLTPQSLAAYQLGPGDVLNVSVELYDEYSHPEVEVAPDGKINLPVYGSVMASGHTIAEVQAVLAERLGRRMRHPNLSVTLIQPRPAAVFNVYILGTGVKEPGVVPISPDFRITEALAKAGGLTTRPEDITATVTRGQGKPEPIDIATVLAKPSSAANQLVLPNDVLTFNLVEPPRVTVDGDVTRPGVYLLRRFPTPGLPELPLHPHLRDLLLAAGSLKSPYETTRSDLTPSALPAANPIANPGNRCDGTIVSRQRCR